MTLSGLKYQEYQVLRLLFVIQKLTFMSLHEHGIVLEAVDPSDEGDGSANEIHDLSYANEGVRLAMHGLNFLCHF